ncbi:hypothetical protein [Spirosoma fluminis]
MKTHQYLTSGILESYLLNLASDQEKEEVERVLTADPEILAELNELETDIEQYFLSNAVPPPPSVKEALIRRVGNTEVKKWKPAEHKAPRQEDPDPEGPQYLDVEINDTHIRVHKYWRLAFIAVFVLSKIFLVLGLYYYFKSSSMEQEIDRLKAEMHQSTSMPRGGNP